MSKELPTPEEIRQNVLRKVQAYRAVFASPQGAFVMADLKEHFDRSTTVKMKGGDVLPYSTVGMSAARDVYLYIKDNVELGTKHDELD